MGQVSLPRLNRVGNSMLWESSFFSGVEHWSSEKLFIFCKYFMNTIFLQYSIKLKSVWGAGRLDKTYAVSSCVWKNKLLVKRKMKDKYVVNHYIYMFNGRAVVLVIYFYR